MDLCMFFENYIKCYIGSQGFRSFWNEIKYLFLSEYIFLILVIIIYHFMKRYEEFLLTKYFMSKSIF